ncbi:MAG TPA: 4Fe-4S binding protein [Candidatus Nanopelagicales bacterium]
MSVRMVPRRSPASVRGIRWTRHALQTGVVAFIASTLWVKAIGTPGSPSGEAFCPFGGFETFFTWVTTGRTVSHVHTANLVLAGAVVLLALAARGAFCGWLCPFGAIQEAVHAAGQAVTDQIPPLRRAHRRISADARWLARADRVARFGRYVVLAWAVGGAAVTGVMVFREYDPWSALLSVVEFEVTTAFVILVAVLVMALVVERPFCRYACPLGAVIGIVGQASPVAVQRNASACIGCDLCNRGCPMGLAVHSATRVTDAQCIGCLECLAACPSRDALAVTVSLPFPAIRDAAPTPVEDAPAIGTPQGVLR